MLWLLKRLKYRVVFLHFCMASDKNKQQKTQKKTHEEKNIKKKKKEKEQRED